MSFLSNIARWAEEHIPLIGDWIARLVEKIEDGLEAAWGWIERAVSWIENTWIPYIEDLINTISLTVSEIAYRVKQIIEPAIDALEGGLNWVKEKLTDLARDFDDLIHNLPTIVYDLIPDWIKEGAKKALDDISNIWNNINSLYNYIKEGLSHVEDLIASKANEVTNTLKSWVTNLVDPIKEGLEGLKNRLRDFLDDPIGYIRKAMDPIISSISQELSEFSSWVKEKVHGFTDAILGIDDYLAKALEGFIISLIAWFMWSFIDDLAHLEYDPRTKQVYGKPKNPVTIVLIWFFEMEKPENPYKSVKGSLDVVEHKVS